MKSKQYLTILAAFVLLVTGCGGLKPGATFNPKAVYYSPPEGVWITETVYDSQPPGKVWQRSGRMWLPPGTAIVRGED